MTPSLRACALLLAAAGAVAGQDVQPPSPTLRVTVTLVQVDAVVTDSAGRHIADLGPRDFELLQDGEPQKLTYFSYIPGPPPADPVGPIAANQVRRTVALVVDDLALPFDDMARVRSSLRTFVERQMQPGDLVALVRTGGGIAILEQFTTDKRVLLEAIDLMKWRFVGRAGLGRINPLPGGGEGRVETEYLDYGYTMAALGALRTIDEVVDGMKRLPGRKSVVFFSDGFRMNATVSGALDKVTDLATRGGVAIYTVDPGGVRAHARELKEDLPVAEPDIMTPRPPLFPGEDEPFSLGGMADLASRTGGLYYRNRNDIPECIREAANDQFGYYLLGYSPRGGTFGENEGRAKFHRVTVRVARRGLQVRWKSGFNGVPDAMPLSFTTGKTREQQLLQALASPFAATDLKVRLTSIYYENKQLGPFVHSLLHFDGNGVSFELQPNGDWTAKVDIVILEYRGLKQPLQQRQRVQEIRLPYDMHARALKEGFVMTIDELVKEPGMFLMRAVVRDHGSQKIGSATQYVHVPDTRKGQLAVTGVIVKLGTPELLKAVGISIKATERDGSVDTVADGGPAIRRYHPGDAMLYGYMVVNPKWKGSPKTADVTAQMHLFRNGKLLYTGPLNRVPLEGQTDPIRLVSGGALHFGTGLKPGEYVMELVVNDRFAKKKNSQAAQWVDFEVTK